MAVSGWFSSCASDEAISPIVIRREVNCTFSCCWRTISSVSLRSVMSVAICSSAARPSTQRMSRSRTSNQRPVSSSSASPACSSAAAPSRRADRRRWPSALSPNSRWYSRLANSSPASVPSSSRTTTDTAASSDSSTLVKRSCAAASSLRTRLGSVMSAIEVTQPIWRPAASTRAESYMRASKRLPSLRWTTSSKPPGASSPPSTLISLA